MIRLLAGVAATAALFPGTSQQLAPQAKEIGFTTVVAFARAKAPASNRLPGYRNGVVALYAKGTSTTAVQAFTTIFVYRGAAEATASWQNSCAKCAVQAAPADMRVKAEAGKAKGEIGRAHV